MSDDTARVRWGVLGTGVIARAFARAVAASDRAELVAVGSRTEATARSFADEHEVAHAHGSYADVISDADVEAVYIATPHPDHAAWAVAAAQAGKHLLVEKPLTVHARDAAQVLDAVAPTGVVLVEGFHYRFHEQTERIVDLLVDGTIGEARVLEAAYGFHAPFEPEHRLFNPALGGGGILDVGCYPVSMAVLVARAVGLETSDAEVRGAGRLGGTGVDEWAAATVTFGDRLIAQVACAVSCQMENGLRIFGSNGTLHVRSPWGADRGGGVVLTRPHHDPVTFDAPAAPPSQFTVQVDHVSDLIRAGGSRESPLMPWSDSLAIMRILDAWRAAAGVVHPD